MDRRTTIKWVLAASALPLLGRESGRAAAAGSPAADAAASGGYGTDPNLTAVHHSGEFWPLTLSQAQRSLAAVLSDLIIPADEHSAAASTVGVVDFIDEWVSAPYPAMQRDRPLVLQGFNWMDAEAQRRFGKAFVALDPTQHRQICDDICDASRAAPERSDAARFFARYRDLTAGAFYSTAAGRKDLNYIGNVPLPRFDGPPPELLQKLKLL
jgi:hypothetical protein